MLYQVLTLTFTAIFIGISNSAGIGGGTVTNVLLILGMDYTAKQSIVISYILLMGGGLAATLTGAKKFTPSGRRYIDYDLVLLTLPMMMSGAIVGVMLNHLISELIITIIFVILIGNIMYTSYTTMQLESNQTLNAQSKEMLQTQLLQDNAKENRQFKQRLSQILAEEKALIPLDKLKVVVQIYVYTIIIILFRGGKTFDSIIGLQSCGIGSYILVILHIMLSYLYCKSTAMRQYSRQTQKQSLGFVFKNQKQKMSDDKMREGMFNGFIAGVLGATVAIGGGLVLIPLWLKAGIEREVIINSTAPLIFFSSSVSFLISALLGQYDSIWIVLMYLTLSFVGSFVIKKMVMHLIETYRLKKLIYILLLVLTGISLSVFLPLQYFKLQADSEKFKEFDSFC